MKCDYGRRDGAGGVHGSAANGAGKHRLQRDNRTDDYPSCDPSLARAGGYAEDDERAPEISPTA
jgi:hypothetical protein